MVSIGKFRKQTKAIKEKSLRWRTSIKGRAYIIAYRKEYYRKNKKKIRAYNDEWIRKNPERFQAARLRYSKENAERERIRAREWRRQIRKEVLALLGGKCRKCGWTDARALQIDHVKGGGIYDSNKSRTVPGMVYLARVKRHIKRGGKKYQLLCANCNWIKRHEQKEHGGRRKYA